MLRRDRFLLPPGVIYLDGNSLGPLSRDAEEALLAARDAWRDRAIGGWTDADPPWIYLAERLGARLAPLIGAEPDEAIAAGSTTVNLHQLLATLFQPASGKDRILIDALAFPSDRFAVESHLRLRGLDPKTHLRIVPARDGYTLDPADLAGAFTEEIAVAVLPSVVYTSGQLLPMAAVQAAARAQGARLLWDLSHSIGIVPHALSALGADAAFWCHYKWLNAGPGAVGGLYLNRRHARASPGLAGWFGQRKEALFDRDAAFVAADGAAGLQIGTTPVLSLAPLDGALRLIEAVGIQALREESLRLTAFLRGRIEDELGRFGVRVVTPRDEADRGGHIALVHPDAGALSRALRRAGVVPDHRPPDLLRLAPSPLYTSEAECDEAVRRLREILQSGRHREAAAPDLVP